MFNAIQGSNEMRSFLERAGFRYVHIESGWAGSRCGPTVQNCVRGQFVDGFVWQTLQMTYFTEYIEGSVPHPYVQGALHSLEAIAQHGREEDSGRDFVFAHILIPHPPIQLNRDCNLVIDPRLQGQLLGVQGMNEATREFREAGYQGQRACLNEMVLSTIEDLPSDASVVITADHGTDFLGQMEKEPKDWSDAEIEERFQIFHAARLPEPCDLAIERDLVNLVRAEVGCIVGEALPALAPYHEITPYFTTDYEVRVLLDHEIP
jgi:GNAT superfamily N-acetyltransferase